MSVEEERLLDFLVRVGKDLSLVELWIQKDAQALLDKEGARLSEYHRQVLLDGYLDEIRLALEKEPDVSAHQGRAIGPCWVLVKG